MSVGISEKFTNVSPPFCMSSGCPPSLSAMAGSLQVRASISEFEHGSFLEAVIKISDARNNDAISWLVFGGSFCICLNAMGELPTKVYSYFEKSKCVSRYAYASKPFMGFDDQLVEMSRVFLC